MRYHIITTCLLAVLSLHLVGQSTVPHSAEEYGKAFTEASGLGFKMDMPLPSAMELMKGLKVAESGMDFRTECTYSFHKNGLKELTFYFDKDNHQPLYEIIIEFEDADTLEALCVQDLGPGNHPRLQEHWIMSLTPDGYAFIIWRFENKLIMASNLADTELAGDYTFEFDQAFIEQFLKNAGSEADVNSNTPTPPTDIPADLLVTQTLSLFIENAPLNYETLKGEAVPGKTNVYYALVFLGDDPQNTNIRKKDSDTWTIESKVIANRTLEEARIDYQALIKQIEGLEALGYNLVKKSEYATNTSNTYLWDVQNLDGDALGIGFKVVMYAAANSTFAIKIVVGKY